MEESLNAWLDTAAYDVLPEDAVSDTATDMERIVAVGQYIFGLDNDAGIEDVLANMTSHLGFDVNEVYSSCTNSLMFAIEASLVCSVSSSSKHRTQFVQAIMTMDTEVQQHLMGAIKNNLEHYLANDDETVSYTIPVDNEDSEIHVEDNKDGRGESQITSEDVAARSQTALTAVEITRVGPCSNCEEKTSIIEQITAKLEESQCREKENESKLRAEIAAQANKLIDAELAVIDREEKLAARDAELHDMLAKWQESEEKVKESTRALSKMQSVQDEIDILRCKAERTDAAEEQAEKLRVRLDELKGVKQQLKLESEAHAETHAKLLTAEQELDTLRRVKTQMEDYRAQCAEYTIRVDELTARLKQREEQLSRLNDESYNLRDDQEQQRMQAAQLNEQLRAAEEELRERSVLGIGGVGEGMSELNPALMQELNKLRAENAELLRKIDASSLEALDVLESQVADQKCINSSLQEKWLATKDSLAAAMANIAMLNQKISLLSMEYAILQRQSHEASLMSYEEINTIKFNHKTTLALAEEHFARTLAETNADHAAMVAEMTAGWNATKEQLEQRCEELDSLQQERDRLEADLLATKASLESEISGRAADNKSAKAEITELKSSHEEHIAKMKDDEAVRLQRLEEQHETALTNEMERCREASAELDGERIKRRRVEREKKYFEAEAQRLKTQLTVTAGGGASGQEIEEALKEIKTMQQQLDEANQEIQMLRRQGGNYEDHVGKKRSAAGAGSSGSGAAGGLRGSAALRPQRMKAGDREGTSSALRSIGLGAGQGGSTYDGYLELSEVTDKKVEQLMRERRELIAKNLEENKERMELSQKLMLSEKEVTTLKARVTKLTLEKERVERRLANLGEAASNSLANSKRTRMTRDIEVDENYL